MHVQMRKAKGWVTFSNNKKTEVNSPNNSEDDDNSSQYYRSYLCMSGGGCRSHQMKHCANKKMSLKEGKQWFK